MKSLMFIKVYLVIRNTLNENFIPPFMMREAGIQVNDNPKIQVENTSKEYHFLWFTEYKFSITL